MDKLCTIHLDPKELATIVNALLAVSPSGGSSATLVLARKLQQNREAELDYASPEVCQMQAVVIREYELDAQGH